MSGATADALARRLRLLNVSPGSPTGLGNEENVAEPIDTARRQPDVTPSGMQGPRGVNLTGERMEIAPGLPSTQTPGGGWPERQLPKEKFFPFPKPPQVTHVGFTALSANSGRQLERACGHPIGILQIDNYSNIWLYIPTVDRYVPPNVVNIQYPVYTSAQVIIIVAEAPPGIVQPALIANTGFACTAIEGMSSAASGTKSS